MSLGEYVIIFLGGLLLVFAGIKFLRKTLSPEAKQERRRRRSNAPIASNVKRPMVKFSVKTGKSKRK